MVSSARRRTGPGVVNCEITERNAGDASQAKAAGRTVRFRSVAQIQVLYDHAPARFQDLVGNAMAV